MTPGKILESALLLLAALVGVKIGQSFINVA